MSTKYVTYKDKTYVLVWQGDTKFGKRAKLTFLNGAKEFWVDAEAIAECAAPAPKSAGNRLQHNSRPHGEYRTLGYCWECGCHGYLDRDGYCGC